MAEDLDKPLLDPENFNREGIDLVRFSQQNDGFVTIFFLLEIFLFITMSVYQERLPLEEVFEQLRTSPAGLSSEDAEARLQIFGPNMLEEKPVSANYLFTSFVVQTRD